MKKKDLMRLRQPKWETLFDGTPAALEVRLVPSEMPPMMGGFLGISTQQVVDQICERAWIDFRGLENGDGTPVVNTKEARLDLYTTVPNLRDALNNTLQALNNEIMLGEDSSGSDSDSTVSGSSAEALQTADS